MASQIAIKSDSGTLVCGTTDIDSCIACGKGYDGGTKSGGLETDFGAVPWVGVFGCCEGCQFRGKGGTLACRRCGKDEWLVGWIYVMYRLSLGEIGFSAAGSSNWRDNLSSLVSFIKRYPAFYNTARSILDPSPSSPKSFPPCIPTQSNSSLPTTIIFHRFKRILHSNPPHPFDSPSP
jgi:hypothetical protein